MESTQDGRALEDSPCPRGRDWSCGTGVFDLGQGLILRPLEPSDADALFRLAIANRARLQPWLPWLDAEYGLEDAEAFIAASQAQQAASGVLQSGLWIDGELAGCIGLRDFDATHRTVAIGYWLGQEHEGLGLMARAVAALGTYAFDVLGVHRLEIRCALENVRSRAIPERLGFVQDGVLRQAEWVNGRCLDLAVYSLMAHERIDAAAPVAEAREPLTSDDRWCRTLTELQDVLSASTAAFFRAGGLRTLHLPLTTDAVSSPMGLGSDSKPVRIDFLGEETYLADSMQFMLEYGVRIAKRGCYYLMPSFRGEDEDTRHLNQFYHAEAEIPGTLDDVIALVERYLRHLTQDMMARCGREIRAAAGGSAHVDAMLAQTAAFPRLTFREARARLGDDPRHVAAHPAGFHYLTHAGEAELIRRLGGFVWVTHFDHLSVPFYQAFADEDGTTARAADLLFGMGETVGAGERHATEAEMREALRRHGVEAAQYGWYGRMKTVRPLRTSGFGLGTERYLCWLLQHHDIRDCRIRPFDSDRRRAS